MEGRDGRIVEGGLDESSGGELGKEVQGKRTSLAVGESIILRVICMPEDRAQLTV